MIDKFKKYIPFDYIGRNKSLQLNDALLSKYGKKIIVVENNPSLTDELKARYQLRVVAPATDDFQDLKEVDKATAEQVLNSSKYTNNQFILYTKIFLPVINERGLENIFSSKFDYSQRYYFLSQLELTFTGLLLNLKYKVQIHLTYYRMIVISYP